VDPGFDPIGALPGVTALGAINHLPMSGYTWSTTIHRTDAPPAPGAQPPRAAWRFIWGDYFGAMRIPIIAPIIAGRTFRDADTSGAPDVGIVNQRLAREHFGSATAALGQHLIQRGGGRPGPFDVEIVGVVGDVHHNGLDSLAPPELYRPLQQTFMFPMQLVLRSSVDPAGLAGAVREAAYDVDPAVPVADLQSLPAVLADSLGRPRLLAVLFSIFAAIGVLLSAVGLYGVVAVRVGQRVREMGIRLSLGASPRSLARGVVKQGIGYAAGGLLVGIPAAFVLARYMDSVIFGITAHDPWTFAPMPLLLAAVTALACYLPTRRAARVDPVAVIRATRE
jgi:predicted permease